MKTQTQSATSAATYFWSGSNRPGEIAALAKHGQAIGVAVDALDKAGRGLRSLELLGSKRISVNVAQNGSGKPILMLSRNRAELPTDDTEVRVGGQGFVFGFRKIAVNVARSAKGGSNVLSDLLRGMFGHDAGARGKGHRVTLERTAKGWAMSEVELEAAKSSGAKVFVDSGAFGEVSLNVPHKCSAKSKACRVGTCVGNGNFKHPEAEPFTFVDVKPIDDAEWIRRLDAYKRIALALGSNAFLVAPDKVGNQAETLRRLARYADRVRELRSLGAQIIVPLQRGEMTGAEFDSACSEVLGFSDYIRGIPSKKAAASVAEIAALSASLPADARIHLLGLGPFGDRFAEVVAAIGRAPELVFCDSVRIKALVGRTNGPNGGRRILTALTDRVKAALGFSGGSKLRPADADRVKFGALDAYFENHFAS